MSARPIGCVAMWAPKLRELLNVVQLAFGFRAPLGMATNRSRAQSPARRRSHIVQELRQKIDNQTISSEVDIVVPDWRTQNSGVVAAHAACYDDCGRQTHTIHFICKFAISDPNDICLRRTVFLLHLKTNRPGVKPLTLLFVFIGGALILWPPQRCRRCMAHRFMRSPLAQNLNEVGRRQGPPAATSSPFHGLAHGACVRAHRVALGLQRGGAAHPEMHTGRGVEVTQGRQQGEDRYPRTQHPVAA